MVNFFIVMEYFEKSNKNMDILIFYPIFAPHPHKRFVCAHRPKIQNNFLALFRMRCPGFHGSNLGAAVLRENFHTFHLLWSPPHCTSWVFSIQQQELMMISDICLPSYCFLIVIFKQPKFSMKISFWKWMKLSTFNILLKAFCNRPDWLRKHQ